MPHPLNSAAAGRVQRQAVAGPTRTEWSIRLPLARPLSLNSRQHHMARARSTAALRSDTRFLVRALRIGPREHLTVGLIWTPKDRRRRDADNVVATLKVCCDALVDEGLAPDDTPQWMTKLMPVIAEPDGDPRIVLTIEVDGS